MMNDPVNMIQLVSALSSRPRGRACIILTHDYRDQKEWAAELARKTDSEHLDLLELFAQDVQLSRKIVQFSIPTLFEFLKNYKQTPVLVVSGIEFLKATWAGHRMNLSKSTSVVLTATENNRKRSWIKPSKRPFWLRLMRFCSTSVTGSFLTPKRAVENIPKRSEGKYSIARLN